MRNPEKTGVTPTKGMVVGLVGNGPLLPYISVNHC